MANAKDVGSVHSSVAATVPEAPDDVKLRGWNGATRSHWPQNPVAFVLLARTVCNKVMATAPVGQPHESLRSIFLVGKTESS